MFEIGKYTTLKILRETEPGLYLGFDSEAEEVILLPHKYKPESYAIGDELKVFIYLDYEERPIATTLEPFVQLHSFGFLRCADVTKHGAFMDWGLEKHLFVSFKEQARPMKVNNWYIVYLYLDEQTNRLAGSSKTNQFLQNDRITVEIFDEVEILVTHLTEKGANVIINGQHKGLIYMEDIFEDLNHKAFRTDIIISNNNAINKNMPRKLKSILETATNAAVARTARVVPSIA